MRLTHFAKSAWRHAYGVYAWLALIAVVVPFTLSLFVVPGVIRRRKLARFAARLFTILSFSPIRVTGWQVPDAFPCIVVANHASYLDGIVLTAVLPARFAFLIKREMASVPIAGHVLKMIGSEFVDRDSASDRHRVAKRLVETAKRGWTMAVFPEGTLDTRPGLRPFRSGAFTAALRGRLPILPVVIRGTREKLPGEQRLPAPGRIDVHICEPIPSNGFDGVEPLIAATRASILAVLGEPDLQCAPVG